MSTSVNSASVLVAVTVGASGVAGSKGFAEFNATELGEFFVTLASLWGAVDSARRNHPPLLDSTETEKATAANRATEATSIEAAGLLEVIFL